MLSQTRLKMRFLISIVLALLLSVNLFSQKELVEGFNLLEERNYEAAQVFFSDSTISQEFTRTAKICYGRALGLGGNSTKALSLFRKLAIEFPEDTEIGLNLAEALLWNNNYEEAIVVYQSLLTENPNSFVANYGFANANAAINKDNLAIRFMDNALAIQPNSEQAHIAKNAILLKMAYNLSKSGNYTEAASLINTIDLKYIEDSKVEQLSQSITQAIKTNISLVHNSDKDSQENESTYYGLTIDFMFADRHRINLQTRYRQMADAKGSAATQQRIALSDKIKLGKKLDFHMGLGVIGSAYEKYQDTRIITSTRLSGHLSEKLYTELGYEYDNLDFNLSLLKSELLINKYTLAANYMLTSRLGIYSRLQWQVQSDANQLNSRIFSIYYSPNPNLGLKLGSNLSFQSYKYFSDAYFSPELYRHYEFFVLLEKTRQSGWTYSLLSNWGQQKISDSPYQSTLKIEAKLGYLFKSGVSLMTEVKYNNAVEVNTAGAYTYSIYGVYLSYCL